MLGIENVSGLNPISITFDNIPGKRGILIAKLTSIKAFSSKSHRGLCLAVDSNGWSMMMRVYDL